MLDDPPFAALRPGALHNVRKVDLFSLDFGLTLQCVLPALQTSACATEIQAHTGISTLRLANYSVLALDAF